MILEEFPISCGSTTIYAAMIAPAVRAGRRAHEREAVGRLVDRAFGPGTTLSHRADGAPYIAGSEWHISVSHCSGLAILAVDPTAPVGVDIETPREQLLRISGKFLDRREHQLFGGSISLLLRAWTAKEAVFKAAGISDLTISEVTLSDDQHSAQARGKRFAVRHIEIAEAVIAIAQQSED